jgi:hypothetical protein
VIEKVQVDNEVIKVAAEVGTLRRVKHVATAAIALLPRRTVPQR